MGKKTGRPKKAKGEVKGELIQFRADSSEKRAFKDAAAASGQELSVWIRDRLRRMARQELEDVGQPVTFLPSQGKERP